MDILHILRWLVFFGFLIIAPIYLMKKYKKNKNKYCLFGIVSSILYSVFMFWNIQYNNNTYPNSKLYDIIFFILFMVLFSFNDICINNKFSKNMKYYLMASIVIIPIAFYLDYINF